jgi:N-acetylglucosaminyldiphosphoundecaprenol N-acetyl-beta-D-mannosaminyltransferase
MRDKKQVRILGVRVDDITNAETLQEMERLVAEGGVHQVVTVNPEFVMVAQHDHDFCVTINEADLALPDGMGLLWASKVLGQPLRERVAGSDVLPAIARLANLKGYRLYLLGAAPGVSEIAANVLCKENPHLIIAGTYAGSPRPEEEDAIVARIIQASPDFLFVAYGAPRQDLWIRRNLARLQVPVCMGVGGALDFIAGVAKRAPVWMRRSGLEWLFRLVYQPWRWRRMVRLPVFAYQVLLQRMRAGTRRK